ncbi:putative integral membrane protein [Babesia bovis T2Bo]|uniref:putative integral membrane protein n=1 Tax=Babesia bovis T2Bo TaxID=484906 RepID=UPI001D44B3D7|nr:putative integral membrane protein [Babesia bovis T2Bo]EDO07232.2 putative integral membrane protein [Babesia bovis T2Bo]
MAASDTAITLDDVCRFYHPNATFPCKIRALTTTGNTEGLLINGNLLDQQLSLEHLSKHEMILIISNGSHGRNVINYLYRERVFAPSDGAYSKYSGLYYICPRRVGTSEQQFTEQCKSWIPTGLSQSDRVKLHDAVKTIDVVTTEELMQTFAIFLMEIGSFQPSLNSVKDTFLEALVQNRATKVIVLFDYRFAKSNDLRKHMETVVNLVESGHVDNIDLYLSYDDSRVNEAKLSEALVEINNSFKIAFHGSEYEKELSTYIFKPFKVPSNGELISHLLGGDDFNVANFVNETLKNGSMFEYQCENAKNIEMEHGIHMLQTTMESAKQDKLQLCIEKLERDIDLLHDVSTKHVRLYRNQSITYFITSIHSLLRYMQNCAVFMIITASVFIKLLSKMNLEDSFDKVNDRNSVLRYICRLGDKYTFTQWITFYLYILIIYITIYMVGRLFGTIEKLDPEAYNKHKTAMLHMESLKSSLRRLKGLQKGVMRYDEAPTPK